MARELSPVVLVLAALSCLVSGGCGAEVPRQLRRVRGPPLIPQRQLQRDPTTVQPPAAALVLRGGSLEVGSMSTRLAWTILFGATGFELVSTAYMHKAQGFSKLVPSFIACFFYAASFYAFNLSLRALEISVAYAVWSAVVMAALAFIGMTFLGESVTASKIAGIGAIIVGTVLLSLADAA